MTEFTRPYPSRSSSNWLSILLALVITIFLSGLISQSEATVIGITAVTLGLLLVLWLGYKNPRLQLLLMIAFMLRAGAGLTHIFLYPLPDTTFDAAAFEAAGWEWAQQGWNYAAHNFTLGSGFYSWIISLVYLATDRSPLLIQVINNLLAVGIVLNCYKICRYFYGEREALKTSLIAVLMPSMILYGTTTHREAFFTFFFTLGTYYFVKWYNEGSIIKFIVGSVCISFAACFHYAAIFCLATFYGVIYIIFNIRLIRKGLNLYSILSIFLNSAIFIIVFYLIYDFKIGSYSISKILDGDSSSIKIIAYAAQSHAEGRLAYLQDFTVDSFGDLFLLAPLRIIYFFFSPFIWNMPALSDILISGEGVIYFIIIILIIRSLIYGIRQKSTLPLLIMLSAAIFIFSFGASNSGTAFRHKAKLAPLMIALIILPSRQKISHEMPPPK